MATTTVPTTLDEYRQFVRKEALKIQKDMGWPDDKLNETLRALRLPEKVDTTVFCEITTTVFVPIKADDVDTVEEAKAKLRALDSAELRAACAASGLSISGSARLDSTLDAIPEPTDGGYDITMTNQAMANWVRSQGKRTRMCETYNPAGTHYCTRNVTHEGRHAYGNGTAIVSSWDQS